MPQDARRHAITIQLRPAPGKLLTLSVEIKQAMWQTKQAAILAPIVIQHRQTFRRQKSGVQYGKMCKKSRHL